MEICINKKWVNFDKNLFSIIKKVNKKYYYNLINISSKINFRYICPNCNKLTERRMQTDSFDINKIYYCKSCNIKKTNLKRYGVENVSQLSEVKEKIKQINLDRYGVEYGFQSEEIKNKIKQTMLKKYGCEYSLQSEEIRHKVKQTNIEKYGVECSFQSEEIKDKIKQTNIEKYGFNSPLQNEDIKKKITKTMLRKYGDEHYRNIKKTRQTNLQKYGVEHLSQNPKFHKKIMSKFGRKMQLKTINENLHYQSIPELNFIHFCQDNNIDIWDGPSIPYYLDGKKHIYHIDFETLEWVVEIKSSHGWYYRDLESGKLGAKNSAAEDYARVVGKEFRFLLDKY